MRFLYCIKSFYTDNPAVMLLLWVVSGIGLSVFNTPFWILSLLFFVGCGALILKVIEDRIVSHRFSFKVKSSKSKIVPNLFVVFLSFISIPLVVSSMFALYVNLRVMDKIDRNPVLSDVMSCVIEKVEREGNAEKPYRLIALCDDGVRRLLYTSFEENLCEGDSLSLKDIRNMSMRNLYPHIMITCVSQGVFDVVYSGVNVICKSSGYVERKDFSVREWMLSNINNAGISQTSKTMLSSMAIGENGENAKAMKSNFAMAGVAHVLVVSGFHLALFVLIMSFFIDMSVFLAYKLWLRYLILVVSVWFFACTTGMGIATVRASVFATLYYLGRMAGRETSAVNVLASAALLQLFYNPMFVMSASFVLSFSSVLSIILFYERINSMLVGKIRFALFRYVWQTLAVSLSVQPLLLPLLAYYFGYYPLGFLLLSFPITLLSCVIIIFGWVFAIFGKILLYIPFIYSVADHICIFTNEIVGLVGNNDCLSLEFELSFYQLVPVYIIVVLVGIAFRASCKDKEQGVN